MALSLACLLGLTIFVSARISVDPVSQHFVDETGCVRVFHGVNVVYKVAPYYPQLDGFDPVNSLSDTDLAFLASQGMNVIRLGVLWNAVQLAPGVVNETYIGVMRDLVTRAGAYGILTLVDAHQDLLSPQFCGEGVPNHAIQTSPGSVNGSFFGFPSPIPVSLHYGPDGYPLTSDCLKIMFGAYYFSFACASAWQSIYDNATIGDYLADHWVSVASAFTGMDSVLGYELLNEPWVGDFYKYPLHALVPGEADIDNLIPLYNKVYAALRTVDNDTIVFYEPSVHESYFNQASGFTSGPGGHADDSKQAFAYHIYCENQNSTGDITNITDCGNSLAASWATSRANVAKIGGGSMLTEFGAVGVHESSIEAIGLLCDHADTALESWTYWTFKSYQDITTQVRWSGLSMFGKRYLRARVPQNGATESWYNADGSIQSPKVAALSRTYAPFIAGVPSSITMSYNTTTAAFLLSYTINTAATGKTTIYLNEVLNYPSGFYTSVAPVGSATVVHRAQNFLDVVVTPGATGPLTIAVRAK